MKKQLILGSLMALAGAANAQWTNGAGSDIYKTLNAGRVGIGLTTPAQKLDILTGATDDGIKVTQTTLGGSWLYLNNTTSAGRSWGILSSGTGNNILGGNFALYDLTGVSSVAQVRMFVSGSTGNTGFGSTSPANKVTVQTAANNDGMLITQTGTSASALHMTNSASGGRHWALFSTGSGNSQGAGNFSIFDYNAGLDRLFINGSNGNVGIGIASGLSAKLHVVNNDASVFAGGYFEMNCNNFSRGIYAEALGAVTNWGATFLAGSGGSNETQNVAIIASLASSTNPNNDWVAYLMGRTYCTSGAWTSSDRKLKDNIRPIESALSKLKLLQPSTYTFKTGEYKGMNLPEGEQMGLIAQELEKVFPSAVAEVKGITQKNAKGEVVINTPDHKSVNYTSLIPVLIAGVQEQQTQIEAQQKTISQQSLVNADLQQQLNEQKELINSLKTSGVTGINSVNNDITGFQMSQNEPNPFTHETVVKYNLPQSVSKAFMAVYDLTGKQVTTLPVDQRGASSVTITSEKLSAGIYIYSIVADGKVVDSKRMIVADK